MKVLKFILWPILLVCLVWISIIFFVSFLITSATFYFSEGRVKLTRVDVSPQLKIRAAVVDFSLPEVVGGKSFDGASRAVTIDWKIKDGFELFGVFGPSSLKEHGAVASTNFTLKPTSIFDWNKLKFQLEFEQVVGKNLNLPQGSLAGVFISRSRELKDIKLTLPKITGVVKNISFGASALSVAVNRYLVDHRFNQQNLEILYSMKQVAVFENYLESSLIEGGIKFLNGEVFLKTSLTDAQLAQGKVKAESFKISSTQPLSVEVFEGVWDLQINDIVSVNPAFRIESYSGEFTTSPTKFLLDGAAIISQAELKSDQYFIGQIKNGLLDVALTTNILLSQIDFDVQAGLKLEGIDDFNVGVNVQASFSETDFFKCLEQRCGVDLLKAHYRITTAGSYLDGILKCDGDDCFDQPLLHVIQTDDTNSFFQGLSNTGLLSPLSLPIAYMAISGGEVVGDGHILNF